VLNFSHRGRGNIKYFPTIKKGAAPQKCRGGRLQQCELPPAMLGNVRIEMLRNAKIEIILSEYFPTIKR
jgi:hypothetical protein